MSKILVLFAHPALQKSRVNRQLIRAVQNTDGVTFHDLYERYPEMLIDVPFEQGLLLNNDFIIFQHPFYWYSTPALLKEWQDLVLEHGWAYGRDGNRLHGKTLLSVITTGGREEAYQKEGYNNFTMRQLLAPIEQTANLCGMRYLPPFVVHGTHMLEEDDIERHTDDYRRTILALRDGRIDFEQLADRPRLNSDLNAIIEGDDAR